MLHIVMAILKFIGILLAVILGVMVLLLCVVLFTPLRYELTASAKGDISSIKAKLNFSWLFHMIKGVIVFKEKKLCWHIRLFWKKITDETVEETEEIKEIRETKEIVKEEAADEQKEVVQGIKNKAKEKVEAEKKESSQEQKEKTTEKKKGKYTIQNICDKMKIINETKNEVMEFIQNESHVAAAKRIKNEFFRFLRFLKPKKFHLKLHFGFDNPAITGKVLAAFSMLYPFVEGHMDVTPEFQEEILEGDVYIKGRFRCVYAIIVILHIAFDRNIWSTIKDLKRWKSNK